MFDLVKTQIFYKNRNFNTQVAEMPIKIKNSPQPQIRNLKSFFVSPRLRTCPALIVPQSLSNLLHFPNNSISVVG